MIKPEELRIGIYFRDPETKQIGRITRENVFSALALILDYGGAEGVPLTPEILEKAGFKNNHLFTTKFRFQCLDGYAYVRMSASTDSVYIENIKDLHQLQNLYYSLMGEDLELHL